MRLTVAGAKAIPQEQPLQPLDPRPATLMQPATAAASPDDGVTWAFYPGTGAEDCLDANVVNAPVLPLWRADRVDSTGRGAAGGGGTGSSRHPPHSHAHPGGSGRAGSGATAAAPHSHHHVPGSWGPAGRVGVRRAIDARLVPALRAFAPDLILLSAGFDGGVRDVGNSRNDGRATPGMNLTPADFAHVTAAVLSVARSCCPGRVVSVLEGGYGQWATLPYDDAIAEGVPIPEPIRAAHAEAVAAAEAAAVAAAAAGGGPAPVGSASSAALQAGGGAGGGGARRPASRAGSGAAAAAAAAAAVPSPSSILVPVIRRANLADNCAAHLRALVDGGAGPALLEEAAAAAAPPPPHRA